MSKTSKPSRGKRSKPFTPTGIRRFFFKLELLGKRQRERFNTQGSLDPVVSIDAGKAQHRIHPHGKENAALALPFQTHNGSSHFPACVALQNEDTAEDAIVITALENIPFCCHEDLVTMSREKLINVALSLNAKLPSTMAIDVSRARPNSFIRSAIELIVGLRGDVPQAPKAARARPEGDTRHLLDFDMHAEMNKSPPTSPLASRGAYSLQTSLGSPRLERLDEEEEGDPREVNRPKRRKVSGPESVTDTDVDMELELTPTPLPRILRTQSQCTATSVSPSIGRVLRSHSQKLEKGTNNDIALIKGKRPDYRYQTKTKRANIKVEPAGERLNHQTLGIPKKTGHLRPTTVYHPFGALSDSGYSRSRSNTSVVSNSSQMSVETSFVSSTPIIAGTKRKRSLGRTDAERQMTTGIGEMNI